MESGKSKERKQAMSRGIKKSLNEKTKSQKGGAMMGYGELQALVEMLRDSTASMKIQMNENTTMVKKQAKLLKHRKNKS